MFKCLTSTSGVLPIRSKMFLAFNRVHLELVIAYEVALICFFLIVVTSRFVLAKTICIPKEYLNGYSGVLTGHRALFQKSIYFPIPFSYHAKFKAQDFVGYSCVNNYW